jgi:outer membrane receptor protein involved in Fe transport
MWRIAIMLTCLVSPSFAQGDDVRIVSGTVVTASGEVVPAATVTLLQGGIEEQTRTAPDGRFRLTAPPGPLTVQVAGRHLRPVERRIAAEESAEGLELVVSYVIAPLEQNIVITASALEPALERRNAALYRETLFSRDDQVFQTLDAGISAGQHEGGGKSLEVRRFGFNLDHGGVSGGLKVLVDDVPQNQSTQGHGQGYLGQLKSLTPELVEEVEIINGPFRAEYGDFSGLGVVHIRQRESLADRLTAQLQGGSFHALRTFVGWSPELRSGAAFLAYEGSRTDGPFEKPLGYKRHNFTTNYTWKIDAEQTFSIKFNAGTSRFNSSGQIPLDEVAAGNLDRLGFVDPDIGGRAKNGTLGLYYKRDFAGGDVLRLDGFVSRSLFDLYSNFTFVLNDPVHGDEIQQHDSRLIEGANAQYLHAWRLFGQPALLVAGGNLHANQIRVGLFPTMGRKPIGAATLAHADLTNLAGYMQQSVELAGGRLHLDGGLRYDWFHFGVDDILNPGLSGAEGAGRAQPKANLAFTPSRRLPLTLHLNYGRGIASQDARGIVREPAGPRLSTTDFYQAGVSGQWRRLSFSADTFLIDRSHEQVYIPDDGTIEFRGPSRAYGFELKNSVQITRRLSLNSGITRVGNAFYRGTAPREHVTSAPHVVANGGLTLSDWRGWNASLRYRYASGYPLDELDPSIRAIGYGVLDLSMTRKLRRALDLNVAVDNLTNRKYYETQNHFQSRVRPGDPVIARIHGTPGYPVGVTVGVTYRIGK